METLDGFAITCAFVIIQFSPKAKPLPSEFPDLITKIELYASSALKPIAFTEIAEASVIAKPIINTTSFLK